MSKVLYMKSLMKKPVLKKRWRILNLTLREFVQNELKRDCRIVGLPFFHSILDMPPAYPYHGSIPSFENYKTVGDIPMKILIRAGDTQRSRIQGCGPKTLLVLSTILGDYDYSGRT